MSEPGYRVVASRAAVHELPAEEVRRRIRSGMIKPTTLIAVEGSEDFFAASAHPELAELFAEGRDEGVALVETDGMAFRVKPARLITYLTLAGLTGAMIMSILAPLCMIIGSFARFIITTAAFGAVLALGINSALRENDRNLINISAAGFAMGGVVAWFLRSGIDFSALHLAIIGFGGGLGLARGLRLPMQRAVPLIAAAVILFPMSVLLNPIRPGSSMSITLPIWLAPLLMLIGMILPAIPFAIFGGILGAVLSFGADRTARA